MGIANISGNIVSDSGVDLTSKADLVGGLIPSSQLPSYVDDVLEYANLASFPTTGETGKIYVDLATNKIYRWSGSVYVEVSAQAGTTWGGITGTLSNQTDLQNALNAKQATLSGTGFVKSTAGVISYDTNTYLTSSTVLNTILTPYAVGANTAVTASDTIETAIEKLQGQVNARLTAESDTLATVTGRGATTGSAISITNATTTTSAATGALVVSGGIGVAGSVFIGTNLTTGRLTMGQGITNQDIYLTITSPGVGFANGFIFTRGSDGAGIKVIETASDATMYEIYMSDNPDGGDMLQFRFTDWQSPNGLVVPIQTSGKANRYVASTHTFLGGITQNTAGFFTTSNFGGTNGSDNQLQVNNVSKLRTVGSTVNITALNTSGYNTSDGNVFWIKLDTTTTFAWGYGSPSGTAVATGIALSTSSTTLSNGIQVTFSATTGAIGDTFVARVYKTASNVFSNITATSFVKSGGTSSQFLKADGTVDSTVYTSNLGTVTSVAAITLGTTGTDLSSSVATGTTTPVITLNVPTASATNRGALSSADWTTFNNKQNALGFTPVPTTRTLTINGVAYDLSANRSWTTITGSGTNGQVTFWTGASTLSGSSNFFWNNSNSRLGLGTATPSAQLHTTDDIIVSNNIYVGHGAGEEASNLVVGGGLLNRTTGNTNTIFGYNVGDALTTGSGNTLVGSQAGSGITTGNNNTAIGVTAGTYNTTNCISVGYAAQPTAGSIGTIYIGSGFDLGVGVTQSYKTLIGLSTTTDTMVKGALHQESVTNSLLKANSTGKIVPAIAGTDYLSAISATSPLTLSSGVLNISQATNASNGYLSSADWITFNAKQNALSGTGFIKISGTSITYDNTIYTPSSRLLTINGTAYDLSADRSWTITPGSGMRSVQTFTATSGQTTFTVTGGYTTGLVDVYVNGARLSTSDFTATNGTSVVLAVGVVTNDIVDIVSYTASLSSGINGSGTTNYVSKFTSSNVLGNSLIFDNGTNVGIGNASPSAKLHVTGTILASSTITGSSLIKSGGTSAQILMADGSVITAGTNITISGGVISSSGGGSSGSGTTNYHAKWTSTSALGNSLIFDNGTSIGMFNAANGTGYALEFNNNVSQPRIDIVDNGVYTVQLKSLGGAVYLSNSSVNPMIFSTSGVERLRILSTGNVGIGIATPALMLHVNGDIRTKMVHFNSNSENRGHRIYSRTMDVNAYATATNMRFTVASGYDVQFQYEVTFHATRTTSGNLAEIWYLKYTAGITYNTSGTPNERWWDLREQAGNGIAGVGRNNQTGYFEIQNSAYDSGCRLTCVVAITCSNWDAVTVTFP